MGMYQTNDHDKKSVEHFYIEYLTEMREIVWKSQP